MIVLLDIEWIEKNEINLTQLSAIRVNDNWEAVGSLDLIAKPSMACLREQDHVAFGGYSTELFANSFSAEECMADFVEWLEPEDIFIVWAKSNIRQARQDQCDRRFPSEQWEEQGHTLYRSLQQGIGIPNSISA